MMYFFDLLLLSLVVVWLGALSAPYFAALGWRGSWGWVRGVGWAWWVIDWFNIIFNLFGWNVGSVCMLSCFGSWTFSETWGAGSVKVYVLMYLLGVGVALWWSWSGQGGWVVVDEFKEFFVVRGDTGGVSLMYSVGGGMLITCAWVLLLCLFVVLELTRGLSRGALRAV
uniref:NADH dehydrogenase subunit 6 n=1 Tax=Phractocephalus hemioliopterus TaxID=221419 RepID=A0A343X9L1_9TELE|nr:NADH dehydrogenase subunit 6 [Phractocephalus hemioliopterus]